MLFADRSFNTSHNYQKRHVCLPNFTNMRQRPISLVSRLDYI